MNTNNLIENDLSTAVENAKQADIVAGNDNENWTKKQGSHIYKLIEFLQSNG